MHSYIHIYIHIDTKIHTCVHPYIHAYIHTYVYVCMSVYVCMYTYVTMHVYVRRPICMCVYVGLCVYMYVRMYVCIYVYVCICMCVYVCMHICVIIIINSHGLSARIRIRCQFHQLPSTSSVRRHLCIFVYVCIIHVYVLEEMSDGKMSYSKREEEFPGVNCPGVNCPEGNCPGIIVLHSDRRLPNFRFVRITAKSPRVHAWMIGVLWTWNLEAEHGVTMDDMLASPWMTCIVEVRFQNTCRCDTRGEKNTRGLQLRLTQPQKARIFRRPIYITRGGRF